MPESDPAVVCMAQVLDYLGADFTSQHIVGTPARVIRAYEEFLFIGMEEPRFTTFDAEARDMILVGDIHFYSLCAHHLLPFFGEATIAYIPSRLHWWEKPQMAGLSKLVRVVNYFSHRFQVQEELTSQVANYLSKKLSRHVAVAMKCEHLCMSMRGANSPGHKTVTMALRGAFRRPHVKAEVYRMMEV